MKRHIAELQHIDNNETITKETHYEFLYHLQKALLLALRDRGKLNAMQHRHAEEALKQQRCDRGKSILQKGNSQ